VSTFGYELIPDPWLNANDDSPSSVGSRSENVLADGVPEDFGLHRNRRESINNRLGDNKAFMVEVALVWCFRIARCGLAVQCTVDIR
jgi:hypothetical protein